ncbi:NO-inducible flavohemoprotein [Halobacteriovorax marinus]|nr:NO-inducible flavohemoprotein [Halobacteriovorax marinus]
MLESKTIEIIKSTAPILEEHGVLLTKHFYKKLFEKNPEVMPYFNRAHQEMGTQQEALAGAICAYAKNIDNLSALSGAVSLIANKHSSLKIKPEHYPIVGVNLLESIKEVLGDGATDDIISAWKKAYFFLADILIEAEKNLYNEQLKSENGFNEFKKFRVVKKVQESSIISSFYLSSEDGLPAPSFKAGQYITIRVPFDGMTTMRNYSLSSFGDENFLRVSIKREDALEDKTPARYVSNYMHSQVEEGDIVEVGYPNGIFTLQPQNTDKNIVCIAGGIGITPLLSMIHCLNQNRKSTQSLKLIHANKNDEVHAFKSEVESIQELNPNFKAFFFYDELKREKRSNENIGFITREFLTEFISNDKSSDFYICGPKAFMKSIKNDLLALGVEENQIHYELFGPVESI